MSRLSSLFSPDSRLMKVLDRIADLVILNLLTLVCCLPVITAGASLTALCTCLFKLRANTDSYLHRDFFRAFKSNFRQATGIWLLALLIIALLFLDYYIFADSEEYAEPLQILVLAVGIAVVCIALWALPLQAYFINPIRATIRNAILLAISRLHITIMMLLLNVLPYVLILSIPITFGVYVLLGISGIAWICSWFLQKEFEKIPVQ